MRCKNIERLLLSSYDRELTFPEEERLKAHLVDCAPCRRMKREYDGILGTMRSSEFPEIGPYFWERLQPRLNVDRETTMFGSWKPWIVNTVSAFAFILVLCAAGLTFFSQGQTVLGQEEMSDAGVLLLQDQNPFQETRSMFEEENAETRSLMLLFTSLERPNGVRRYFP
ncbi:zf-HC2 domain-containing protein [Acidobacteriota bacterium]